MAQKIQAEMSTSIALDVVSATKSIKGLTQAVKSSQSAWKSQESIFKSSGDYLKAAQARYEGLGKTIDSQKNKIEALKAKQSALKGNTQETANSYLKLQKDIDSATQQLTAMREQQERAKTAMAYQESGLAKLQAGYKQMNLVSQSYVQRLQTEGKATEANQAKLGNYKDSISNLTKQLDIQEKELERVATASGKSSSAYAIQSKRVNETATALAKAKTDMGSLNSAMQKANPTLFTRLKTALASTNAEASKTPSLFKKIVAGGLVTNAISSAFSTVTSNLKATITSGLALNEAGEKLTSTWKAMGKSSNDIAILSSQLSYLRSETGATGLEVNSLQKVVDTFTNGVTEKTAVISAGIAGIATASHTGGAGMDTLAKSLSRVLASGNLTSSGLARLEKQAPTLGAQLAKAAGVSQEAFSKLVASGKVSASDLKDLLYKVGTTSSDTFKEYGKTAEGSLAQIEGGWTSLKAKMTAPLLNVKNSGMSSLAEMVNSPVLQGAATSLGKAIATIAGHAEKLLEYISAHKADVTAISSDLYSIGKTIGSTVWTVFKQILADVANLFGTTTKNSKALQNPLGTIHSILDKIAKNKPAIQTFTKTLLALFAIKKATSFAFALDQIVTQLTRLSSAKLTTSALTTISSLVSGQSLGGVGQSVKSAGGYSGLTTAGKVGTATAGLGVVLDAGSSIYKAFTDKKVTAKYTDAGKGIGSAIGGGIGLYFGGPTGALIGATIGRVVGAWGGKAAKKFVDGWNSKKRPAGNWLSSLGWDAKKVLNPILTGIHNLWKSLSPITKQISTLFKTMWKVIVVTAKDAWSVIKPLVKTLGSFLKITFTSLYKVIKPLWSSLWKILVAVLKSAWELIKAILKTGLKVITDLLKVYLNLMKGNWRGAWQSFKNLVSDAWHGIRSIVSVGIKGVYNIICAVLGSIKSVWRGTWNGLSSFFSGIWSGMRSSARRGMSGVVSIINSAIRGINWVWNKFTGHRALSTIKFATGGVVGASQRVMLNDGAGSHWKELYQTPSGHLGMFQHKNAVTMLPVGTRVFNGEETHSIMQTAGITHYATGGVVGSIANLFKSGWDKATEVASWLKNPISKVSRLLTNAVAGMSASTPMFTQLGKGIVKQLIHSVASFFKKGLKSVSDELDGGSNVGNPTGTSVLRWKPYVIKALKANGFSASASQVAAWLKVIKRESNGDPTAVNNWDSNAKAGIPSKGLVQTIEPTFRAYAFSGHKNILNGYDDLLAGIHYMKAIYGSGSSAFSRVSGPEGYANGGIVNGAKYRLTGEAGAELIMPLSQAKSSRAWQLLGQAVDRINGGKSNQSTDTAIDSVNMQALLESNANILTALNTLGTLLTQLSFQVTLDTDEVAQKLTPSMKKAQDALTKKQRLLARTTYTDGGMTILD